MPIGVQRRALLLAIDPGPTESAFVLYDAGAKTLEDFGKISSEAMLKVIARTDCPLAIEMIASYGMAVGATVFETCVWIGRYIQASRPRPYRKVYRQEVKLHICRSVKAKDSNIRTALLDRWGGEKEAIGRGSRPGPLFGISADVWQALGVAVTATETKEKQ